MEASVQFVYVPFTVSPNVSAPVEKLTVAMSTLLIRTGVFNVPSGPYMLDDRMFCVPVIVAPLLIVPLGPNIDSDSTVVPCITAGVGGDVVISAV